MVSKNAWIHEQFAQRRERAEETEYAQSSAGKFSVMSNERECKAWAHCSAGTYVSRAGSQKVNRACTACVSGKFTNAPNLEECRKWTACSGLDEELGEGTASSDRICGVDKKKFRYVEDDLDAAGRNLPAGGFSSLKFLTLVVAVFCL